MNKRDLSRYFSGSKFSRMPLGKALVALSCALAVTVSCGAGIAFTAVNAANNSSSVPVSVVQVASSQAQNKPEATATPEPTQAPIQLEIEATAVQQSVGVTVMDADSGLPVLGQDFEVQLTPKSGKASTYTVDPETGTLLIKQVDIGEYTVSVAEREGFVTPEPVTLAVKEKVQYKADVEAVKDQIKQSSEVNEAEEDNGNASHVGAGTGSGQDPTLPEPTAVPTPEPSGNDYDYDESSTEERKTTVYIPDVAEQNGRKYLKYADGSISPYYVSKTATAEDGTEFLVEATLDAGMVPTPTPVPTAEPTPEPTAEPTAVPEPTQVPADSTSNSEPTSASASLQTAAGKVLGLDLGVWARGGLLAAGAADGVSTLSLESTLQFYDESSMQGIAHDGFAMTAVEKVIVTLYSGWYPSTSDKQAYYDPSTHQKVTGSKVIAGTTYTFDENGTLVKEETGGSESSGSENTGDSGSSGSSGGTTWVKGVDVSKYQGNIDWNQVKASGIEFAIIRVGYRGYGTGVLVEDSTFRQNIKGATAAGLKVGLYFYSQAINETEAVEEASMVISLCQGYNISYPIYFDTEKVAGDTGRADNISRAQRTANAVAFCETIRNSGYKAGVYSYASWFYNQLNMASLSPYSIWIAQYRNELSFDYNYDIWQYSSTGSVPGIPKPTDMNVSKLG
ncbi:GH25 family lysozyme [Allofournierella massiliensis]|uniref:GH25 family lysozyme n=1 Tax=Allofournierella massiliensis TaxID=1650663 RepID=A0ABT7UM31_9FIRM|nr:GH25 family lysozyme [Fournierella massiliensis]MDM8199933.1 GH25 family lysozyme [Fournierella massiliensis]